MRYKHVFLIGVDGAGAFFRNTETPNLDAIFANGAVSYDVLTSNPTISAECWGSMLLGITPEVHGLTNSIVSAVPYPTDGPFPSVFRVIREAMPDAELGAFSHWNPINSGIIEEGLGVTKDTAADAELTDKICAYLEKNSPTFSPAARRSAHPRRPLTSRALCSQKSGRRSSSDHQPFETMPCSAGARPVRSDACATQVTAGNTLGAEWKRSPAISSIPLRSSNR